MSGLEFMVIEDPTEGGTRTEHSGVWVIRKQQRKKFSTEKDGSTPPDEVTPISCYFVVEGQIFMAPRLGDILSNRLVRFLGR